MKSAVFYIARNQLTPDHEEISVEGVAAYIRMELFHQHTPEEALDEATPALGESVMNSHIVED